MKDEVYREKQSVVGNFEFNHAVADVFDDMISRSVPGYGLMLSMIGLLTKKFAAEDSNLYDLGCSLGAGTLCMQQQAPASCTIHAVDSSPAMIDRFRLRLSKPMRSLPGGNDSPAEPRASVASIALHQSDLRQITIAQASFVALNLTLQFLPVSERKDILNKIHQGLRPGGALLLSEKINFHDPNAQELLFDLHHDFKRANGYSDMEIAQKRTALENTLMTETLSEHCERLDAIGFQLVTPWLQCFNFVSILAVKQ